MELKILFPEGLECGVAGKTMSIKVLKLHNTPVTENWRGTGSGCLYAHQGIYIIMENMSSQR